MSPRRQQHSSAAAAGRDNGRIGDGPTANRNPPTAANSSSRTMTSNGSAAAAAAAADRLIAGSCITAVETSVLHFTRTGGVNNITSGNSNTFNVIDPNQFAAMPPLLHQSMKSTLSPSPHKTKEGGGPMVRSSSEIKKGGLQSSSNKASVLRRQQHPVELVAQRLGLTVSGGVDESDKVSSPGGGGGAKDRTRSAINHQSESLVTRALDEYRLLETRVKVGRLGKGDTCEARAACLLRRCVHQLSSSTSASSMSAQSNSSRDGVSWENLASHVGAKPATLQTLHSQITNYLVDNNSNPQRQHARQDNGGGGGSGGNPRQAHAAVGKSAESRTGSSKSNRPTVAPANPRTTRAGNLDHANLEMADRELWAALSIRLQCPILWVQQAKALWSQLEQHVHSMPNAHERRGYQYDMFRYRPAYQAACLHYVLTRRNSNSNNSNSSPASKSGTHANRKRGSKKNGDDDSISLGTTATINKAAKRSNDGSRIGGGGSREVTHKMVDFVLPNSFTYLELQQVSKQVAKFVEEIGQIASSDSSSAVNGVSSAAVRAAAATPATAKGESGLSSISVRGRSVSLVAEPTSSNVARHVASTNAKKRGPSDIAVEDERGHSRSRLSHQDVGDDQDDDASSSDREWTTSRDDPYDEVNISSPSKSSTWIDQWLWQLWNDKTTIDRDDDDALERRANDVLRRYGLLTNASVDDEDDASSCESAELADPDCTSALLTQ